MKYTAPDGFENKWIRGAARPSVRIGKVRDGVLVPNSNFVAEVDGPYLESLGFTPEEEAALNEGPAVQLPE